MTQEKQLDSPKVAKKIREVLGVEMKTVQLQLLYTKEVHHFLKQLQRAHLRTARSTLHFG